MGNMELNSPQTITCPLCSPFNEHEVQLRENKNGKPYFTCRAETGNTTVNLNGENATRMLKEYRTSDDSGDDDGESLEEPDEPEDDGDQSLEDLLGGDDGD